MYSASDLLDALEGIAYITNPSGLIIDICRKGWAKSATANEMPALNDAQPYIGRSVFDSISGDTVRYFYRRLMDDIVSGKRADASFTMRCDAPSRRRELRMSVTPIAASGINRALLFHALPISETLRPPINLFDRQALFNALKANQHLPFVVICSFCLQVRVQEAAAGQSSVWVEAEEYYRLGGSSDVQLSHGLCPSCAERMKQSILDTSADLARANDGG